MVGQHWKAAYHSFGGITLTMPDFIPYVSTLSMNFLKLRNCAMVYRTKRRSQHKVNSDLTLTVVASVVSAHAVYRNNTTLEPTGLKTGICPPSQ